MRENASPGEPGVGADLFLDPRLADCLGQIEDAIATRRT